MIELTGPERLAIDVQEQINRTTRRMALERLDELTPEQYFALAGEIAQALVVHGAVIARSMAEGELVLSTSTTIVAGGQSLTISFGADFSIHIAAGGYPS